MKKKPNFNYPPAANQKCHPLSVCRLLLARAVSCQPE